MKPAPPADTRTDFPHLAEIQTRWADNDAYGHVNNVVYYAYFDTVINRYLIESGGLDIHGAVIGVCVESQCRFLQSIAFPERLEAGPRGPPLRQRTGADTSRTLRCGRPCPPGAPPRT